MSFVEGRSRAVLREDVVELVAAGNVVDDDPFAVEPVPKRRKPKSDTLALG